MKPNLDPTSQEISQIGIELIELTGGTQSRVALSEVTVDEYAEAMQNDGKFPPIDLYYDGENYWLADGFHRVRAAQRAGLTAIVAHVHQGSRRDAILHSVGANSSHGLRRTNADKRRAVETLLQDDEWSKWSDREIAKQTNTSHPFVAKIRADVTGNISSEPRSYTTKHGTTATMRVKNIGNIPSGTRPATSANAEVAAQGKSLGLPTRGDSVLPESDVLDELTHISCVNVDDRIGALPGGAIAASVESMLPEFEADNQNNGKFLISDELTCLREENLCLSQKLEKLEAARLEDSEKFAEFHREVQPEIVRLNRENHHLQKLVESLQAENQALKQQLEAIAPDQFQQPAVSAQDLTTPVLTKPSINLGDTVAAADPSSLAYYWKGEVVRMHESNPDLVYVRYPERLDPTKMKGVKTKQDTITCRIDSLRRIGAANG